MANQRPAVTHPPLTPLDVARLPVPGGSVPVHAAFSPTGRVLTYLAGEPGELDQRLYALELDVPGSAPVEVPVVEMPGGGRTGALSLEEQLRRERAREVAHGVTLATWAAEADALVVPLPDGIYVVTGVEADPRRVSARLVVRAADGPVAAARISPDGTRLAFVRAGDLYVVATSPGAGPALRLSVTGAEGVTNGCAEFVAQEEMGRGDGLWWSPDSASIAYCEVDERHVPPLRILHQGIDAVGPDAEEVHRYPFAGADNAQVRLGVVPARGGTTVWMDTGDPSSYLARVDWTRQGGLVAQVESRDQRSLRVVLLDPTSGAASTLLVETAPRYVNLHDDYRALADGRWLWSSERSGFRHLELRSSTGSLLATLTAGDWQVDAVEAVDEDAGTVYFSGTRDGATQRHLYAAPLAGGPVRRLTPEPGTHVVTVGPRAGVFVDRFAALDCPPVVCVRSLEDGGTVVSVHDRRDERIDALGLRPPRLVELEADDGTALHGLYYAPDVAVEGPPPLAVAVYGGPHVQLVRDDWAPTAAMRAQALRRLGVAVLVVDNRGSARRGVAFEQAVWHNLGDLEVADQVAGVRWAVEHGLCDPRRVGVYGWSYGGYMALSCLAKAPEVFRAAVAGAPVTDWSGYDTHYTERYMGTPEENAAGYVSASVLEHVGSIVGDLLVVHGLVDENVHFRHTARLVHRLVAAGKDHRLLCFPEERHLPRRLEDRAFMEQRVIEWLVAALEGTRS